MVEGQSVSLLSAQFSGGVLYVVNVHAAAAQHALSYHLVCGGKQWRDSSMSLELSLATHGLYFQLLLLFVMLLCCYPCEHGSLPEQNAKRELAIPDVATTGSLLRKQKKGGGSTIELSSLFDQILKIDIAILSENEIRFNFSEFIRESYKTSSYLHEIFNVQKNHDSLSSWVQKLLLLVRITSSISVGDEKSSKAQMRGQ
ncbi:hypothetical protein T12_7248 [Trichinella patagoniensis]|uniref:Uncharacterized protein n=1 Tax=Trichinella patagoniensis TaxID=990121 RepID=A0A0V0ZS48_9BILA|nr:hypothetical protein T12_7248 [Trichinella patagoniensis]